MLVHGRGVHQSAKVVIAGGAVDCQCKPCLVVNPNDDILVKFSAAKDELRWSTAECALTYNTYRGEGPLLLDVDRDGLADDYGSCYQSEVIGTRSPASATPQNGQTHWYLITGENLVGEGSLGTNSQGAERPNSAACP